MSTFISITITTIGSLYHHNLHHLTFPFFEVKEELQRASGAWLNLVPQTPVGDDRGPLIRITAKVNQEIGQGQAFAASAPPLDAVEEVEVI